MRLQIALLAALSLATACQQPPGPQLERFAAFEQLVARQDLNDVDSEDPDVRWPQVLHASEASPQVLGALIPFGSYSEVGHSDPDRMMRAARRRGAIYGADVAVAVSDGMATYPETMIGAMARGFDDAANLLTTFYRTSPVSIGATIGAAGIVLHVDPDGPCAEAGVRPGDVVVALGGFHVHGAAIERSQHWAALARASPGDELKIEWIRPGVECLSSTIRVVAPRPAARGGSPDAR